MLRVSEILIELVAEAQRWLRLTLQAPPEADFCFEKRFAETATSARDKALSLVSDFICEAPPIPGLSTRQW
jgi:hypothetical protein